MEPVEEKLGRWIAEYRRHARLTQAQLAEKVGVAVETISRLERGVAVPSLSRVQSIGVALGVELHELLRFEGDVPSPKDRALGRLLAVVQRGDADDIEAVTDMAARAFSRWVPPGTPDAT